MSLFDLKTSIDEIESSNHGILRKNMRQVTCLRDVSTSFSTAIQNYRWELSGTKWWIPSKSYFRVRCSLTKANGTPLELKDGIAPAMGLCGNLFQSIDFKMADQTVCRIDRNLAQIDVLKNRLSKSRSWNKSVGVSTNFYEQDFKVRQAMVCSDGVNIEQSPNQSSTPITSADLGGTDVKVATSAVEHGGKIVLSSTSAFSEKVSDFKGGDIIYVTSVTGAQPETVTITASIDGIDVSGDRKSIILDIGEKTIDQVAIPAYFTFTQNQLDLELSTTPSLQSGQFEMIWKPPLGIFDSDTALPCGKYELLLSPQQQDTLLRSVVESQVTSKTPNVDYKFS